MTTPKTTQITFNLFGNDVTATLWEIKEKSRVYFDKADICALFGINFEELKDFDSRMKMDKDKARLGTVITSKNFFYDQKAKKWSQTAGFWLDEYGFINLKKEAEAEKDALLVDQSEKFDRVAEKIGKEKAMELLEDSFPRSASKNLKGFIAGENAANKSFFNDFYDYASKL